ncbi:MAG: 4Fe-4S dicluster domain-containing protein [Nitrospirae bacterium]|nr:4Fe-4S dicluster domain-containing protein [Nitrospirota bacterium]
MSMNRRQFLKLASVSTILGVGSATAITSLGRGGLEASQASPDPKALKAKRWGFVVDVGMLKTEEDYQKCIDACHNIHNVPTLKNPKHEIKWIWKDDYEHTFPNMAEDKIMNKELQEKNFLLFCNHCANPACVRVCPTQATFKRKSDGIVMQDMHRCIGCRFCMAACPFGARSFNYVDPRKDNAIKVENKEFPTRMIGVVEKCTACYERLAVGKQPACAEASNGAIVFGDLEDPKSEVRKLMAEKYTIRRKPELGTQPSIYYVIGGGEHV